MNKITRRIQYQNRDIRCNSLYEIKISENIDESTAKELTSQFTAVVLNSFWVKKSERKKNIASKQSDNK